MNLWSTFLDLDKLYESTDEKRWTDQALDELKNRPRSYWTEDDWNTYHYCRNANAERDYSDSLDEDFYNFEPSSTSSWVAMSQTTKTATAQQSPVVSSASQAPAITHSSGKCVVTIVSDKGRLRAMGTDGQNPYAFVAFPNNLRNKAGQQYAVDGLVWNGKNYRVVGNISPISNNVSTSSTNSQQGTAPTAKVSQSSKLVIDNYDNNLSYHISELGDEGDAEDSIEYFENFPEILAVIQSGSDIIIKLSSVPEDEDVVYWILTYALGEIGNGVAENGRYKHNATEIVISDADFNAALNNNLN